MAAYLSIEKWSGGLGILPHLRPNSGVPPQNPIWPARSYSAVYSWYRSYSKAATH